MLRTVYFVVTKSEHIPECALEYRECHHEDWDSLYDVIQDMVDPIRVEANWDDGDFRYAWIYKDEPSLGDIPTSVYRVHYHLEPVYYFKEIKVVKSNE